MKNAMNLWELTRTNNIPNFYEETHEHDCKRIAAEVRKHLRKRFPFCKWSVRSGYNKVDLTIKEGPFEKESPVMDEIVKYAMEYINAWNYDNSDIMTDYFDMNFYYNYPHDILWCYTERVATEVEEKMELDFISNKNQAEKAERERKERLMYESMRTHEIRERMVEKQMEINAENKKKIEENVTIENVDYFLLGCVNEETIAKRPEKVRISREIHLPYNIYNMFVNMRTEDFSFLDGMGGSEVSDGLDDVDLRNMTPKEIETVEWYLVNCVAVYCENELKFVVDPEGFSYCRYILSVDSAKRVDLVDIAQKKESSPEEESYSELAGILEDVSTEIIIENNMLTTWNTTSYEKYIKFMKEWIEETDFPLSVEVVRAIKDIPNLKAAMYRILNEYNSIQEQFKRAKLKSELCTV